MVVQGSAHDGPFVDREKELRIQTAVINRLCKEHIFYESEANKLAGKVEELKVWISFVFRYMILTRLDPPVFTI